LEGRPTGYEKGTPELEGGLLGDESKLMAFLTGTSLRHRGAPVYGESAKEKPRNLLEPFGKKERANNKRREMARRSRAR